MFITNIPAGATDILIIERRKTENILGKQRIQRNVEVPVQLPGRWEDSPAVGELSVSARVTQSQGYHVSSNQGQEGCLETKLTGDSLCYEDICALVGERSESTKHRTPVI